MTKMDFQGAASSTPSTRIDAAHLSNASMPEDNSVQLATMPRSAVESLSAEPANLAAAKESSEVVQQLQYHASQLAEHLQTQRSNLDHRESQLNARTALLENESRSMRLTFSERENELDEKQTEWEHKTQQQEQELSERQGDLERQYRRMEQELKQQEIQQQKRLKSREDELQQKIRQRERNLKGLEEDLEQQTQRRQQHLEQREAELDEREKKLEKDAERHLKEIEDRHKELQRKAQNLHERELRLTASAISSHADPETDKGKAAAAASKRLLEIEKELNEERERLRRQATQLAEAQRQIEKAASQPVGSNSPDAVEDTGEVPTNPKPDVITQHELAQRRKWLETEFEKRKKKLDERNETLSKRRAALEQLQTEVNAVHREALEMRIVTEELWLQISGKIAPAAMTRSLAQLRSKLADHYRLASAKLAKQKHELEQLSLQLNGKYQSIQQQRISLQQWLDRRNEEIEEQAARLVAREQELDGQESQLEQTHQQWELERNKHHAEMQRVMQQLKEVETVTS